MVILNAFRKLWRYFNSIPNVQKTADTVNSMMTVYINNGDNNGAFILYQQYNNIGLIDIVSDIIAIKLCIQMNDI